MPRVVNLRSHLATLPPFIQRLFWVYYSFIALLLLSFGGLSLSRRWNNSSTEPNVKMIEASRPDGSSPSEDSKARAGFGTRLLESRNVFGGIKLFGRSGYQPLTTFGTPVHLQDTPGSGPTFPFLPFSSQFRTPLPVSAAGMHPAPHGQSAPAARP